MTATTIAARSELESPVRRAVVDEWSLAIWSLAESAVGAVESADEEQLLHLGRS